MLSNAVVAYYLYSIFKMLSLFCDDYFQLKNGFRLQFQTNRIFHFKKWFNIFYLKSLKSSVPQHAKKMGNSIIQIWMTMPTAVLFMLIHLQSSSKKQRTLSIFSLSRLLCLHQSNAKRIIQYSYFSWLHNGHCQIKFAKIKWEKICCSHLNYTISFGLYSHETVEQNWQQLRWQKC